MNSTISPFPAAGSLSGLPGLVKKDIPTIAPAAGSATEQVLADYGWSQPRADPARKQITQALTTSLVRL
jgi:hypothetical protein